MSDVELKGFKYRSVKHLFTFARVFEDHGEYEDLEKYMLQSGWRAFVDKARPSPRRGDTVGGHTYYVNLLMPPLDRSTQNVDLYPDSVRYRRSRNKPCFGEALFASAWSASNKLSPQIGGIEQTGSDAEHISIEFHYINPQFYPHLKNPVGVVALDHSYKMGGVEINTLSLCGGRGQPLYKLISEKLTQHFPGIKITAENRVRNAFVKISMRSNLLTDVLDAITYCTDVIWEWVDTDHILLLAGEKFRKVRRQYVQS